MVSTHLDRFTSEESTLGIHWVGGWELPSADVDSVVARKIYFPRRESINPAVEPVAHRSTD